MIYEWVDYAPYSQWHNVEITSETLDPHILFYSSLRLWWSSCLAQFAISIIIIGHLQPNIEWL